MTEDQFVKYWESARTKRKSFTTRFSYGLPLAAIVVVGIFANLISGWYDRAEAELKSNASLIIVIMIALVAIVVFIAIFSVRYRWEQNELHYQEILERKARAEMQQKR